MVKRVKDTMYVLVILLFVLLFCCGESTSLEIMACTLPETEHGEFQLQYSKTPVKEQLHDGANAFIKCDMGYAPLDHHEEFTCNATDPNPQYPTCIPSPTGHSNVEFSDDHGMDQEEDHEEDHHDGNGAATAFTAALTTATITALVVIPPYVY